MSCCLAVVFAPSPLAAGEWEGSLGIAVVEQSVSGSEGSFRTQLDLDAGLVLEDLRLAYRRQAGEPPAFRLSARGLGGAEPAQSLRAELRPKGAWRLAFAFDRRESFFALTNADRRLRTDDWRIDRWRAEATWDGWKAARLGLGYRHNERSGTVHRPLFSLNELYPLAVELDQRMDEISFRLDTRTLPVELSFEQSFAVYETANRRRPAGAQDLDGDDPDLLVSARDGRSDQRDAATSRLAASYRGARAEVLASLLYRPVTLDGSGEVAEGFDIGGGRFGRLEFVDRVARAGDLDTFAGNLRVGVALAPRWVLRLSADHRDLSASASLLGQRVLRVTNPFGDVFEIPGLIDETTSVDVTDTSGRLTLEWSRQGWTLWAGVLAAERDVAWRLDRDEPARAVSRTSDGGTVGVAWSTPTRRGRLSGSAEVEHGSFGDAVFRTDPESVDRLTVKLRGDLGGGWGARLHGRFEQADATAAAAVDRSSAAYGVGVDWSAEDGKAGFGIDLDSVDLRTDTSLLLPAGEVSRSLYDLALWTLTAHGRAELGRARLSAAATRVEDAGETWPVTSWSARARIGMEVRERLELALFGELWSYEEERAAADDFDATRYGVAIAWRLP